MFNSREQIVVPMLNNFEVALTAAIFAPPARARCKLRKMGKTSVVMVRGMDPDGSMLSSCGVVSKKWTGVGSLTPIVREDNARHGSDYQILRNILKNHECMVLSKKVMILFALLSRVPCAPS